MPGARLREWTAERRAGGAQEEDWLFPSDKGGCLSTGASCSVAKRIAAARSGKEGRDSILLRERIDLPFGSFFLASLG